MKKFFDNKDALRKFLSEIKSELCPHCLKRTYLIIHSIVYRKTINGSQLFTGQRIFCSNRGSKKGCGKTFQLYLSVFIPKLNYSAIELNYFLSEVEENSSINESYLKATNTIDSRNAYRWLSRIKQKIFELRSFSYKLFHPIRKAASKNYLIETISNLKKILQTNFVKSYQLINQVPFI